MIVALGLMAAAMASCIGLLILQLGLWRVFSVAPQLQPPQEQPLPETSLTVVIPAYNEAGNIGPCLDSVLSGQSPCRDWHVLVVDDDSSDATAELAVACAARHPQGSARFSLLSAGPRPSLERWVGKNWACTRACLLYTSPSPRDRTRSRMPSSA